MGPCSPDGPRAARQGPEAGRHLGTRDPVLGRHGQDLGSRTTSPFLCEPPPSGAPRLTPAPAHAQKPPSQRAQGWGCAWHFSGWGWGGIGAHWAVLRQSFLSSQKDSWGTPRSRRARPPSSAHSPTGQRGQEPEHGHATLVGGADPDLPGRWVRPAPASPEDGGWEETGALTWAATLPPGVQAEDAEHSERQQGCGRKWEGQRPEKFSVRLGCG